MRGYGMWLAGRQWLDISKLKNIYIKGLYFKHNRKLQKGFKYQGLTINSCFRKMILVALYTINYR